MGSSLLVIVFQISGALYSNVDRLNICCDDRYVSTLEAFKSDHMVRNWHGLDGNSSDINFFEEFWINQTFGAEVLQNSAYNWALTIKKTLFWSEAFAGLFVLASHFAVWFYSKPEDLVIPDLRS